MENDKVPAAGTAVATPGMRIPEFCNKYNCSRSGYAKAKAAGRGPEELLIFGKVFITPAAEVAWLEKQAALSREKAKARSMPKPPEPGYSVNGVKLGRPPKRSSTRKSSDGSAVAVA